MSAALDGNPLPPLVAITAESCFDGYDRYVLSFAAIADREPGAIDDEIGLALEVTLLDYANIPIGQPMDAANNEKIQLSARATVLPAPEDQGALTQASGTITISALSWLEMSGSVAIVLNDPDDVNVLVGNSLSYEVSFTNLAVVHYCPES